MGELHKSVQTRRKETLEWEEHPQVPLSLAKYSWCYRLELKYSFMMSPHTAHCSCRS